MAEIIWTTPPYRTYHYNPDSIRNIGSYRNAMPHRHVIATGNIIEGIKAK